MSFLSTIGKDFKAVFSWLGSAKGQAVVSGVETAGEAIATVAGVGGIVQTGINLINKWMAEIIKTESLAAAAAQQTGSGTQKSAAVIAAMVPEITNYLQGQNLTSQQVTDKAKAINDAVVNLLNLLDAPAVVATPVQTIAK